MSYIPNCRTDENYNYDKLVDNDKLFIDGYDFLAEEIIPCFFDNLDMFDFDVDGEDINIGRFFENHSKIKESFINAILEFIEINRDETIVSILDDYEFEYDEEISEIETDEESDLTDEEPAEISDEIVDDIGEEVEMDG